MFSMQTVGAEFFISLTWCAGYHWRPRFHRWPRPLPPRPRCCGSPRWTRSSRSLWRAGGWFPRPAAAPSALWPEPSDPAGTQIQKSLNTFFLPGERSQPSRPKVIMHKPTLWTREQPKVALYNLNSVRFNQFNDVMRLVHPRMLRGCSTTKGVETLLLFIPFQIRIIRSTKCLISRVRVLMMKK